MLIAIEAKNSLHEKANNTDIYKNLPLQYERTMKRMRESGWTPGSNAFYYVMSKGSLVGNSDDDEQKKSLLKACPHMRVLAGKELEAAMSPTMYWVFKHLRIVGAVYQKGTVRAPLKQGEKAS